MSIIDRLIGDKRRWHEYKTRTKALPPGYGTAVAGIERYLMNTGPSDGERLMTMLDDLADLFERAAADGTPVSAIVGEDPVDFAEEFMRSYGQAGWIAKERKRLTESIAQAVEEQSAR